MTAEERAYQRGFAAGVVFGRRTKPNITIYVEDLEDPMERTERMEINRRHEGMFYPLRPRVRT